MGAKILTILNLNNDSALLELTLEKGAGTIANIASLDLSSNTLITELILEGVPLSTLDLSNNTSLIHLNISLGYNMTSLNLKNGNNIKI